MVVGLGAASVVPARASEEWVFESAQPIWTDNSITVSRTTVLTFNSTDVGICAVIATCDSNQVMTDRGPQQRNVAFAVGLRVAVNFNSNESSLFGDTLRVTLLAPKHVEGFDDFSFGSIVAATFECIMANAAQSPAIRFVALRLDGPGLSKRYEGVFNTAAYRKGPRRHEFTDTNQQLELWQPAALEALMRETQPLAPPKTMTESSPLVAP